MTSTEASTLLDISDAGGVRVLAMGGPRLNTLTRPLRRVIIQALDDAELDPNVRAVVLIGRDGTFSAGADLAEFDSGIGLAEPSLHETINGFLDRMTVPVVAAISGTALGGGLELALSAHYRIAARDAVLGLPETRFGFIPGAGGTQRLPRLLGLERALAAILDATHLTSDDLEGSDLVDRWTAPEAIADEAIAFALEIADQPIPRARDRQLGDEISEALLELAAHQVRRRSTRPDVELAVIRAISAGRLSFDAGITEEFRVFKELAASPRSSAARHVFLAERQAARPPGIERADPPRSVGVIGAGMMGRGIALALLRTGMRVAITDVVPAARAAAAEAIRADAIRGGNDDPTAQLTVVDDVAKFGTVDAVIEAVVEDPAVKLAVFRSVAAAHPDAVIASNTSGLDLETLAAQLPDPGALIGLHFFAPAPVMTVVEVVRTESANPAALATGVALVRALDKLPILSRVGHGFIGNRIFDRYLAAALDLVVAGLDPHEIDKNLVAWGMRMGPFATLDLIGNDVVWHARTAEQAAAPGWRLVGDLVERGRLGRKSGRGWYDYESAPPPRSKPGIGSPDPTVIEGTLFPMIDEGVRVLSDGIAARPGDIDVLFLRGYGFPSDRGGPMWFADTVGVANVVRVLSRVGAASPPHERLVDIAAANGTIGGWTEWS